MTQEHKDLLFKDLCARLPYGVKVQFSHIITSPAILKGIDNDLIICDTTICELEDAKPYLLPLSSMTEEQYKTYWELEHSGNMEHLSLPLLEWLYKNHFDVNGLIPLNLANDATNLNIY